MKTQNQIKRKLLEPEAIKHVQNLINIYDNIKRTELADKVCEQFNFFDPCGNKQRSGCLKALRELEKIGCFILPQSYKVQKKRSPIRLGKAVAEAKEVPGEIREIRKLKLIIVDTDENMRIWNELMARDHPRGAVLLVGRQIRYLVGSDHGWLGGLSFSSAALQLEDRDKWIGWDADNRRKNLHYVINMSRFLIRSGISCSNLASKLLSMAILKLPKDFEDRYGYRPLLMESFVDTKHFKGTCYRASNWQLVGRTKGRGRQDRFSKKPETIKDIYVYPLRKNFRSQFGLPNNSDSNKLNIDSGIDSENWAKNEFGGAPVGDKRLSSRLVKVASEKAEQPGRSYSGVAEGDWSKVKGYYRMIDSPNNSAVTMSNILLPHRERTIRRMKAQQKVLCIQDGSDLNYSGLNQCEGLGVIGTNQTGTQSKGLHLHTTLAIDTNGVPLGVLRAECSDYKAKNKEDKRPASTIKIEEKKTFCWIKGIRDCAELKLQMPQTSLINISDREADFFELFNEHRNSCSNIDLLIRAKHNRKTIGEYSLFETVKQSQIQSKLSIKVPRQSARPKKSKQKKRSKRLERTTEVSLRYVKVKLNPPDKHKKENPIEIWVIHIKEDNPPIDTKPIEWFLITTTDIKVTEDAIECVKWYRLRWRIEDWHRVLKSGCRVEDIAHKTAKRIKRALAINIVIAWRIMLMTLLGRKTPKLPAEVLFSELEIEVLSFWSKKKLLPSPDCLENAVKLVAKLGGYLNRTKDPPPGHQIMWQGYMKLQLMCEGFELRSG